MAEKAIEIMRYGVLACYLTAAAVSDLRKREVPVKWMLLCAGACLPLEMAGLLLGQERIIPFLTAICFGLLFVLLGYVTHEAVGYADGWSIVLAGACLGIQASLFITCAALLASALFAIVLICFKKAGRKTTFPFLPFLEGGFIIWCILPYLQ